MVKRDILVLDSIGGSQHEYSRIGTGQIDLEIRWYDDDHGDRNEDYKRRIKII